MAATSYSTDPTLFLYTSLTAGSSHIITATSRLETILKANKIPFRALDCATDEKARMLWGRRSKGRKLPGLVKYGNIIGDLEQIEEWNEYGELQEQIDAADELGAIPTTTSSTLAPVPPAASTASSGPPSRASSETRHISISEPTRVDKGKDTLASEDKSTEAAQQKSSESPMNVAFRQLGAEAAAKAVQKKAAAGQAAKAAQAPTKEPSTTEQTPVPAATRLSADAATESADTAAEATAAKTPAQLASEGAKKTSVDKIADAEVETGSKPKEDVSSSTQAQILELRRSSSTTKAKSRLSDVTPVEESETVLEDKPIISVPESSSEQFSPSDSMSIQSHQRRQHRGSDIGEASPEEIREIERRLSIQEEEEEDDDGEERAGAKAKGRAAVAEAIASIGALEEEQDTQDTEPKDADKAGVSVGD